MNTSSNIPPGWNFNPSAWSQRLPVLALSLLGLLIAGYLFLFQIHVFNSVWDPFFGKGTEKVLTSGFSKLFPVPDAALGILGYFGDLLFGSIGGEKRWKSMPVMVLLFGLAVGPLGFVSIVLAIVQPVMVHTWCTLCLLSAFISVFIVGPSMPEILATLQYLKRVKNENRNVWFALVGLV
jgi:uncharacterized membrane protein